MEDPSASRGGQFGFQGGNTKMGVKWRDRYKQSLSNSPADTAMWTESKGPCPGHRQKSINVRTWAPWVGRAARGENGTEAGTVLLDAWEGEWCRESQRRFWTLTTHSTGLDFLRPRVKTFTGSLWLWKKPRFIQKALLKLIFTHLFYPIQTKFFLFPKYKTFLLSSLLFPPPHSIVTRSSYQPFFKSCTKANSSRNSPRHFNWPNVINVYSRKALLNRTFRAGFK